MQNRDSISDTLATIEQQKIEIERLKLKGNRVTKIEVKDSNNVQVVSESENSELTQGDVNYIKLENTDHRSILLEALQQIQLEHGGTIDLEPLKQLLEMREQIFEGQLDEAWYNKVLPHIGTVAGIVSAFTGILGLL